MLQSQSLLILFEFIRKPGSVVGIDYAVVRSEKRGVSASRADHGKQPKERKLRSSFGVGLPTSASFTSLLAWFLRYNNPHLSRQVSISSSSPHTNSNPHFQHHLTHSHLTRSHKSLYFKVRWTSLSSNIYSPDILNVAVPSPSRRGYWLQSTLTQLHPWRYAEHCFHQTYTGQTY